MRRLALCLLLASLPGLASAAAVSPPGVNLRWDRCYGDGGVWNKTFACDTNTGSERLVCSFELAADISNVTSLESVIDIGSATSFLPAWWTLSVSVFSPPSCRSKASLSASLQPPPGNVQCADWGAGNTAGGIGQYYLGYSGSWTARLTGDAAVALPATLVAGQEYFAMSFGISHANTVGTGACAGCDQPVCIFLSRIVLTQGASGYVYLEKGANYLGSQYATWQNGYPIDVQRVCDAPALTCSRHYTTFNCVLATPVSTRGSTWAQVKSLYR